ncbi:Tex family protein [Cryomorphaceae bacterium 1068]|nr:Tex family protein [Cryomorphaceae bacterium 1068]
MNATVISKTLNLAERNVARTLTLLEGGATIPFISRYRKEMTGGLDEVQIEAIQKSNSQLVEFEKRKKTILEAIADQGKLTDELKESIARARDLNALEDIYLPFKQKRKTKASEAREKGLEVLAAVIMKQDVNDVESTARRFVKGQVKNTEEALEGARYIMAEWMNERPRARNAIRILFAKKAEIRSKLIKGREEEAQKYRDYFAFSELLRRIPGHRLLAIRRAETEGFLRVSIEPSKEEAMESLERIFVKGTSESSAQVALAVKDAYKRLIKPSIETEFKNNSKEKADDEAIRIFVENLRQLLLTPPVGQKRTLGIDPGFKSGCKTVCLDEQGTLLHNENIYPHPPQNDKAKAAAKIGQLVESYRIDAIAIGNGTAGRETEDFIKSRVRFRKDVEVYVVNEAGASIYSASSVARKEFPDYDVTVRGAVSIGRRLMDPLAELVKIDPKSIGVGQYQHDVDQNKLKEALDRTVESVVNRVGVELNTASEHLLAYVSGLGPKLAENIIEYRSQNGAFSSRTDLKNVKGMGPKAFEQAAGFLRIGDAKNPLDNSAVHPESYHVVKRIAKDLGQPVSALVGAREVLNSLDPKKYTDEKAGLPTVTSIIEELGKIGRDPRGKPKMFQFDPRLRKIEDLEVGMKVPGIVTNIAKFGAFVDVGVKQDGLIHVSQMADRFISDPNEIVKLQQQLEVKVVEVDVKRKRIQLSLKF